MSDKVEKPQPFGRGHNKGEDDKKFQDLKPLPFSKCVHAALNRWIFSRDSPKDQSFHQSLVPQFVPTISNPESGGTNGVKSLDANRYATKKTIAQGMLDIALLTANASQLKYILQVGKQHEFYTLMLTLICVSIGLQILSGLLSLSLNLMLDRQMEDSRNGYAVEWIGRLRVALSFIVFLDNILIAAFDPMGLSSLLSFDPPEDTALLK
ncbi:ninjurin-2 isoform X2 [Fopius arisanus]|uniref:Ninjurin-2 isoform X2 n=1 Tax=Fopius arisanus TaxID=64838 RepID=A0A9R1UB96_9HYME|nr:PREDICTED: ninjurin-2 isoform X2 [Fopius arisanus]